MELKRTRYIIKKRDIRIGFDAKRAFNNGTGLGNYSRHIIKTIATIYGRNATYHLYTPSIKKEHSYWTQGFSFDIHRPRFLAWIRASLWRSFLGRRLKKDKINLYHGLSNELPAGIRHKFTHSIVTIHDLIFMRYPESYKAIDRAIYRYKFSSACRRADLVLATSEYTKRDIIKFLGVDEKKIRVLYQDSSDIYYFPPEKDDMQRVLDIYGVRGSYILCVSAFQKRKNHLKLIEAFEAAQPIPQKLVLAGAGGDTLDEVKALIKSKNLSARVQVLENVRSIHLPTLYYKAQFGVYPSLYEGFGIPLLEAMRMKLPMITNKDGCFREVCGEAALYADVSDVSDLAEKIRMLGTDETLRQQLQKNGEKELERFDPELMRKQLREIYDLFLKD